MLVAIKISIYVVMSVVGAYVLYKFVRALDIKHPLAIIFLLLATIILLEGMAFGIALIIR